MNLPCITRSALNANKIAYIAVCHGCWAAEAHVARLNKETSWARFTAKMARSCFRSLSDEIDQEYLDAMGDHFDRDWSV